MFTSGDGRQKSVFSIGIKALLTFCAVVCFYYVEFHLSFFSFRCISFILSIINMVSNDVNNCVCHRCKTALKSIWTFVETLFEGRYKIITEDFLKDDIVTTPVPRKAWSFRQFWQVMIKNNELNKICTTARRTMTSRHALAQTTDYTQTHRACINSTCHITNVTLRVKVPKAIKTIFHAFNGIIWEVKWEASIYLTQWLTEAICR